MSKIEKKNAHSLYKMATEKLKMIANKVDTKGKLTFYSLYKQTNEGDADDLPDQHEATNPIKL